MNRRLQFLVCAAQLIALILWMGNASVFAGSRQEHVHQMADSVMPFDISKTIHIFRMTETGGVQRVVVRDPDAADQIKLIQRHLRHEARQFQRGDYGDPAELHGADMPGLRELKAGAARIKVTYVAISSGAQLTFETKDLQLLTAIHRWFGAQLSEHGADARAE